MIKFIFAMREISKKQGNCKWDEPRGAWQTSQNWMCPVILTNLYDENVHFSIRVRSQRF